MKHPQFLNPYFYLGHPEYCILPNLTDIVTVPGAPRPSQPGRPIYEIKTPGHTQIAPIIILAT